MLQSKQKTSKKIAFDAVVLGLRVFLLFLEILSKLTCNFTTNNKYSLQVTRNILKLLILPATVLYLFNSIDNLLKNGKNPKKNIEKIEIIAKKLAIIGLCLFILINVNYRAKFFFEEVFIRNKKANKDDYYVPLLDPTVVHYLFLTAAILFLISSIIKCYSAYNKAYGSSNSTYEDKKSFYKSVCFLLLDLAIFLTETLGYEIVPHQEVSVAPNATYDFNLSHVLIQIRDFFYVESSFREIRDLMQPGSSLDNTEAIRVDDSNLSP